MDEKARGGGRDLDSQRLDFHSLGGLQILPEFVAKNVIIIIEKGDRAEERNTYQDLSTVPFQRVTSEKP